MANWKYTVKPWASIIDDEGTSLEYKQTRLAAVLRASDWFTSQEDQINGELTMLIEDLETCPSEEFYIDDVISQIYDLADSDRVWLNPFTHEEDSNNE